MNERLPEVSTLCFGLEGLRLDNGWCAKDTVPGTVGRVRSTWLRISHEHSELVQLVDSVLIDAGDKSLLDRVNL